MAYVLVAGGIGFAVFFICVAHVGLTGRRIRALNALSNVDEQLHLAVSLLPNMSDMAAEYLDTDNGDITALQRQRDDVLALYNPKDPAAVLRHLAAANEFSAVMSRVFTALRAVAQSDDGLQSSILLYAQIETGILTALERYNNAVTALNLGVGYFPGSLLARFSGIQEMPVFDAETIAGPARGDAEKR